MSPSSELISRDIIDLKTIETLTISIMRILGVRTIFAQSPVTSDSSVDR